ncbi:hypothetical protein [Aromatoleum sp.]|uniref:hypothetical protein n=1 Tax=Aromatoleum sp. TaxID=2307007 RepID=UPI002FC7A885
MIGRIVSSVRIETHTAKSRAPHARDAPLEYRIPTDKEQAPPSEAVFPPRGRQIRTAGLSLINRKAIKGAGLAPDFLVSEFDEAIGTFVTRNVTAEEYAAIRGKYVDSGCTTKVETFAADS